MVVLAPIRLDHVKRTIRSVWIDALSDTVPAAQIIWQEQGVPRRPRPLVAMQLVTGPDPVGTARDERRYRPEIDQVDVAISAVSANTRYRIRLNGIALDYTTTGAPTVIEVRDALRDLINNVTAPTTKQSEPVTAVNGAGVGDIVLTPDVPGAILAVAVNPATQMTQTPTESATDCVMDVLAREVMGFQMDVYSVGGVAFELSSRMIAARMRKAIDTPETEDVLTNARVSMRQLSAIADLTGLEAGGGVFESRASFDIEVSASSRVSSSVVPIETVEYTLDTNGPPAETRTITLP
jgi:hypothetical protein